MIVVVNGERTVMNGEVTIRSLLTDFGLSDTSGVAVECNDEFIEQEQYDRMIRDGDTIEIVRFVGGG